MKTTIELSDALLRELKRQARANHSSMREMMEAALRLYLDQLKKPGELFTFRNHSFKGNGVCEGIEEGSWEQIRGMIYEGRGG
jgi:hypothetical protein